MLTWIDWIVVCAPILLGVFGAVLSIRPATGKLQLPSVLILVLLGAGTTAATLYQIRQTRIADHNTQVQNETDKKNLQSTIDGLNRKIGEMSGSIPTLLGDVKGLKPPKLPPPNLTIRLVYPQEVAIVVENAAHTAVADRPKYGVALLDLDNMGADFLRIPTSMGDYIRPGDNWGPNQFMGMDAVKSVVKPGDRIFGSVEVSCPTCVKNRGYWVYIKAGEGGWYAEQRGPPKIISNLSAMKKIADNFDVFVASLVPESKRVPIK